MFGLQTGVGVKIPQLGYLDPTHLFVSKSSTNTIWYKKLLQYFMLFLLKIYSTGLNKKKFSHNY